LLLQAGNICGHKVTADRRYRKVRQRGLARGDKIWVT